MNHISANYLPLVRSCLYQFLSSRDRSEQMSGDLDVPAAGDLKFAQYVIKFSPIPAVLSRNVQCGDIRRLSVLATPERGSRRKRYCASSILSSGGDRRAAHYQGTALAWRSVKTDQRMAILLWKPSRLQSLYHPYLYGVQNTSPSRDGFAGKTCWLAIHTAGDVRHLVTSYHGSTVCRHGETPDAEDALLTDDEALSGWQGSGPWSSSSSPAYR